MPRAVLACGGRPPHPRSHLRREPPPPAVSAVLLGIDLGTTGVKAVLVDATTGTAAGSASVEYPSRTTADGGHEQDPAEWWTATGNAVRSVLESSTDVRVEAVGLSGHMHSVTLIGPDDTPVRPALTWADRRAGAETAELRERPEFAERAGNPVVEAFSAPKLAWVARHEPAALARAVRLVQPKDVLRHRLTGEWGTDTTDAMGTLLYDVHNRAWDGELWRYCGADPALAPDVSESAAVVGAVTAEAARQLGLPRGTPVVAGAADVASAGLGAGAVRTGTLYVNIGTAAQVMAPTSRPDAGPLFLFGQAGTAGFLVMASVYAAGMSLRWAERELLAAPAPDLGSGISPGADGLVYLPFLLGTSAPSNDEAVRAAFLGLGPEHGRAHLARAVVEGVAFGCVAAVDEVAKLTDGVEAIRVGGGVTRSTLWCEAVAAVAGVPVARLTSDASPRGAALLAGVGVGVWDGVETAARTVTTEPVAVPSDEHRERYRRARDRYAAAVDAVTALAHHPAFGGER